MFCPRCGQQQASGDLRFCSRCGLPLGIVAEVLANGGTLPQLLELGKKPVISKRNGTIFSLFWLIFFILILTPFWGIMNFDTMAALSALFGIFGGLMILLFSLFYLKNPPKELPQFLQNENMKPNHLEKNQTQTALPPPQTQAAQDYVSPARNWKAPDTGELIRPGSVTEATTKFLDRDE